MNIRERKRARENARNLVAQVRHLVADLNDEGSSTAMGVIMALTALADTVDLLVDISEGQDRDIVDYT